MVIYLSLGSNLGDREAHLEDACRLLQQRVGQVHQCSKVYYSMPIGYDSNHEYANICARVETSLDVIQVLQVTQSIERELGRTIKNHYADRTIDIDLLFTDPEIVISTPQLTLPHPRMREREFVLVPLQEINQSSISI